MLFQFFFKQTIHLSIVLLIGLLPYSVLADDIVETSPQPTNSSEEKFNSVVPSLIGLTLPEVLQLLPQYDLSLGIVTEVIQANAEDANKVIQQSLAENSEVKRLSNIDISIAIIPPAKTAANVIQKEEKTSNDEIGSQDNMTEAIPEKSSEPLSDSKDSLTLPVKSADELPIEVAIEIPPTHVLLPTKSTEKVSEPLSDTSNKTDLKADKESSENNPQEPVEAIEVLSNIAEKLPSTPKTASENVKSSDTQPLAPETKAIISKVIDDSINANIDAISAPLDQMDQ